MEIKYLHGMGSHLAIDAFGCRKNLDDKKAVFELLEKLPDLIGMKKITKPEVIEYKTGDKKECGITGFILIAESHIAIHTYPEKKFLCLDIFSCREFDYEKAKKYVEEIFEPEKTEYNIMQRGHTQEYDENAFDNVKGFEIDTEMKATELIKKMKYLGFQATHLGNAVEILKKIRESKAAVFLSFTSNMVSSGLREIFAQLVKEKMVDAIITSTGSIEEDVMKCRKPFLLGDFNVSDIELHKKGINRIGNIFVPDERYENLEDVLMPFFAELYEKQNRTKKLISPSELIYELGKKLNDENSILYWATKNNIPIFCPGITDGALGLQLFFFKQKNRDFGIDVTADMKMLADMVLNSEKTAGIILGGGIAKHHLIGINILKEGLDYAIYVTTANEQDGSLSGARPAEAKSWSKIREVGNTACIEAEATLIFPLIATMMKEIWSKK